MRLAAIAVVLSGVSASAGGCTDDNQGGGREPVTIGLIAPQSGALGVVGVSFARIGTAAVAEINGSGGINGRPAVLVVVDDATDATTAAQRVQTLKDLGAIAIVGPATSGAVQAAYPKAAELGIPIISPSSTNPDLADADDGGYMFRNVPNDSIQGIAMAYYLSQKRMPPVTQVVVVQEDSPYGDGLAAAFTDAFADVGGAVTANVKYPQNLPDAAAADAVVADIVAAAPQLVVLIALEQDGLKIVQQWDASAQLPALEWFFTDGARSSGFLQGLPAKLIGSEGTAPTVPTTGMAFSVLQAAYARIYPESTLFNIDNEVFAANVWDAVFLIAAAAAQQERDFPGEPLGGAQLRDSLTKVSRGPGTILHAGQWPDILVQIAAVGDVDYDGASGPCDFDERGETVGPYEVWKITDDGGTLGFSRTLFLEAREIQELAGP